MVAYYNENDPKAAAWLRELINQGHIAPGVVDERSIEDVLPTELARFTQCHFFAGIGVWSYALRKAGWPDDRQAWTGSCPCQPFSSAGKREGVADERHLWPAWYHLISQCRPSVVFGEQVASKDGLGWLDIVQTDLEAKDYTCGAVDLCAAGVGAPHIRQRLWFVAEALGNTGSQGLSQRVSDGRIQRETVGSFQGKTVERGSHSSGLAYHHSERCQPGSQRRQTLGHGTALESDSSPLRLAHADLAGSPRHGPNGGQASPQERVWHGPSDSGGAGGTGPVNGFWRAADWLGCRDGKWRPVEPGTLPLADGAAARVVRLRGYGNAINAEAACHLIASYMDI